MRAFLTALSRLLLRIFFRRIDNVDAGRVPVDGPLLYVLNHPNGLLDPLFILCESPRPVTFLAKAPLFRTPLIKHFVRGFECLPVYRTQDGADPSKNREVIMQSIALLAGGKVLALFPEGTTHSDPKLKPLKTGAARIAASASREVSVRIVPVGIDYSRKATFRSDALLIYGEPIITPQLELDDQLRASAKDVEALNAAITAALGQVTLQAEDAQALRLAEHAALILSGARKDAGESALESFDVRRRLVDGYQRLREQAPAPLEQLAERVRSYAAQMSMLGLPLDHPAAIPRPAIRKYVLRHVLVMPLLLGPALLGILTHYPAYRLVGWLSRRIAKQEEAVIATIKLIGGLLLFPLNWIVISVGLGVALAWPWGLLALLALPLVGFAALLFSERVADLIDRARGLWVITTQAELAGRLADERRAIYDAIMRLDQ
ncbi:1-acyl-sn-glycerol-3-phosphate acyltransferase [Enhygromyxa salina]|uniref:1-acyl-sn-glycerol-3-phosphate acyltransferase n=1 Tax=Enhygromyxa salina TaxID=215803 RepID=A0A0C2D851_9BACT|nr:1-acyl-sn-glycerol-3-phosphate acyltransferase [Enhygromyxa salina]KIG17790.1 1-acyl-sn-glycerol-3-phosphate acyltransferase [Enhygromyxa salina]